MLELPTGTGCRARQCVAPETGRPAPSFRGQAPGSWASGSEKTHSLEKMASPPQEKPGALQITLLPSVWGYYEEEGIAGIFL